MNPLSQLSPDVLKKPQLRPQLRPRLQLQSRLQSRLQLQPLLALLACFALSGAVEAAPVLLDGKPPVANALAGEQSDQAVAPASRPVTSFSSVAATVTSVQWWGYDLAGLGGPDAFVVSINGTPLTGAVSVLAAPPEIDVGVDVSRYTLNLGSAFNLAAGAAVLSVVNDTDMVEWYWQAAVTPVGAAPAYSFRVFGEPAAVTVPEPGALALVALALVALKAGRLRKAA